MTKATMERLTNLRRQLTFCDDSNRDAEIRCRIDTEIQEILSGNESVVFRHEMPEDLEIRMVTLELHDILKLRKSELIHCTAERKPELEADIIRIRTAIATEKEVRGIVPVHGDKACGASADGEKRESRALASEDAEQFKFEAERRLAEVKLDE
jgi:hypothetical protein